MNFDISSLGIAALVGVASGADASIWGMYKDAAHEGFRWPRFFRSIVIGAICGVIIQLVLKLDLPRPGAMLVLFGLAYAAERGIIETWKTFFRDEDQSKYAIPMQFQLRGKPLKTKGARLAVGFGYIGILALAGLLISRFDVGGGTLLRAAIAGFMVGCVIAVGGAWKDAPIEGFDPLKFFRSPIITTVFASALFPLSGSVLLSAAACIGYERMTSENWKTFFFPSKPRGKFADKPITNPEMLTRRYRFVPAYLAIRVALIWFVAGVFLGPKDCDPSSALCNGTTAQAERGN